MQSRCPADSADPAHRSQDMQVSRYTCVQRHSGRLTRMCQHIRKMPVLDPMTALHSSAAYCLLRQSQPVQKCRGHRFQPVVPAGSAVTSETRFLSAYNPMGEWKVVLPRENGVEYDIKHRGDHFFVEIRDTDRPNSEILVAPVSNPTQTKVAYMVKAPIGHQQYSKAHKTDCGSSHDAVWPQPFSKHARECGNEVMQHVHLGTVLPEKLFCLLSWRRVRHVCRCMLCLTCCIQQQQQQQVLPCLLCLACCASSVL